MEAVSREAMEAFLRYLWPGNIRELRNVIEHAFVVGEDSTLLLQDLTPDYAVSLRPANHPLRSLPCGT